MRFFPIIPLLFALTAWAQPVPPALDLVSNAERDVYFSWTPSPQPGVETAIYYSMGNLWLIGGQVFSGSNGTMTNLPPGRLYFYFQSYVTNTPGWCSGPPVFACSISGWQSVTDVGLQECTNLASPSWENLFCLTNQTGPGAFYRIKLHKHLEALP